MENILRPDYLVRFGYHKCLTKFMNAIFSDNIAFRERRQSFAEHLRDKKQGRFISLDNEVICLERPMFEHTRIVHLIRHPKDIVISGYYYHKRGAEAWTEGGLPFQFAAHLLFEMDRYLSEHEKRMIQDGVSYRQLLEALNEDVGMMVEIVWLKYWKTFNPIPYYRHSAVGTFRFEDIMADHKASIGAICDHWHICEEDRVGYVAKSEEVFNTPSEHVRNRAKYQYRELFNQDISHFYDIHFHAMATMLDYPE